jgi:pilus assembly protein CpaB
LSLALRSLVDANVSATREDDSTENLVNVYRGDERETYDCKSTCRKKIVSDGG